MPLDDEQIERYSRQIVLAEVGAEGQMRLGESRVAVVGSGVAAERVVAYLAAAGVGHLATDPALHAMADPERPGLHLTPLAPERFDAIVVAAATVDAAARDVVRSATWTAATFWIAEGLAGGCPPCPHCAAAALETGAVDPELCSLRDAVLGAVVATEVVKGLLRIGTACDGQGLAYDAATATLTKMAIAARPNCECRNPRG